MNQRAFTLIELIMVIVLIGILAAFAAPRLGNIASMNADAFTDKLRADIRYAQNLAMTENRRYRVYFNGAAAPNPGYAAVNDTSGGTWSSFGYAADPAAGGSLIITLNAGQYAGITLSAIGFTGSYIEFDSLGRPYDGGGAFVAAKSVTVTGSQTVTVSPTGAVN